MLRNCLCALALESALTVAGAHTNERGLDSRNFDPAARACTDFFQYANGGWLKSNPIPPAYAAWSLDDEINERNRAILKRVLEDAAPIARDEHRAAEDPRGRVLRELSVQRI